MSSRRDEYSFRHVRDRSPKNWRHENHDQHRKSKILHEEKLQRGIEQTKNRLKSSLSSAISDNLTSSTDAYPRRIATVVEMPIIRKRTRSKTGIKTTNFIDDIPPVRSSTTAKLVENNEDKNNIGTSEEGKNKLQLDHYDSSDEEDLRNTIGNIPVQWYEEYGHVGYDLKGRRISKGDASCTKTLGEIDTFLQREEDPEYWRKVFDQQTGQDVKLTEEHVQKLEAIATSRYPEIGYNPYQPFMDLFSSKREIHPISNRSPDKRSFVPSISERRIVSRMVHAIKMGWMKQRADLEKEQAEREQEEECPRVYDLWAGEEEEQTKSKSELIRQRMHWPAPKVPLPGHAESYRPPPEYLFTEEERKKWEETDPERRRIDFIPKSYDALRNVPFYSRFYEERIERCMDLYLAPRQWKMRLNVHPNQLLPELPDPKDLQPFPTRLAFYMRGHCGQVRSLTLEPECGELLVSGGADCRVRVWALPNGHCLRQFKMPAPVTCVQYCPDPSKSLVMVTCESDVVIVLNILAGDKLIISQTQQFLASLPVESVTENTADIKWSRTTKETDQKAMDSLQLQMHDKIRNATWHQKGDYFATVGFEQLASTVIIHQLSKCNSQTPFTKRKGIIQSVLFHPKKPWFFVGTRQHVLIYDLVQGELKRTLMPGTKWLSCMVLHPGGDNLFVAGLDRIFSWLDLELGTKPWKKLRNHQSAIRSITYHCRYPLLATVSDDATAIVYHAKVSSDLMDDNVLVPVKRLFGHKVLAQRELSQLKENGVENKKDHNKLENEKGEGNNNSKNEEEKQGTTELTSKERLAILCATFHPNQPWLLTSGADGQIALFSY